MRRAIVFFLFFLTIHTEPAHTEESSCVIASEALRAASTIRGLRQKSSVPCYLKNQDEVKKFLVDSIEKKISKERIEGEGIFYKAIGFLPQDFDYKNGLVDLYVSQIGGYYDPEKNHYVMAAWLPALLQPSIAVHELTHALQDQYFNLDNFLDDKAYTTDQLLARSALVEGDATAVMHDYQRSLVGQPSIANDSNVDSLVMQTVLGSLVAPGLATAPEGLKHTLLFPYVSGLRFVHAKMREGGYREVDRIFKSPPSSTEEILHPEKYPAQKGEFRAISPEVSRPPGTVVHTDTLGEFFISAWLTSLLKDKQAGSSAGKGWGGDRAFVLAQDGKRSVFWITYWDTNEAAGDFYSLAQDGLKTIYKSSSETFSVKKENNEVTVTINTK